MGKPRGRPKRGRKSNPSSNPKKPKSLQPSRKRKKNQPTPSYSPEHHDPILFGSDRVPDEPEEEEEEEEEEENEDEKPDPEDLQRLLEPCSKDQLITFLSDAAASDPSLVPHILSAADRDIAHRKLFVRGIGWDVSTETLLDAFRPYGPILTCNVVVDKASGRNKGYGFVVFASRRSAAKALESPDKKIGARMASCQLASVGYVAPASSSADLAQRRIYVSNVDAEASPEKLRAFFATFGEVESGPSGFDMLTGKSRGFAIFVYRTQEGAARALQEPYKMFEGHQLHCKLAFDHKGKLAAAAAAPAPAAATQSLAVVSQQPALNAVAAAQNAAMLGQNPAYGMLFLQNQLLTNAALNQNSFAALNPAALAALNPGANLVAHQGQGYYGGLGYGGAQGYGGQGHGGVGVGLGGSTLFEPYRTQESAGLSYGGSQLGQSSSVTPTAGFFRGFPQ